MLIVLAQLKLKELGEEGERSDSCPLRLCLLFLLASQEGMAILSEHTKNVILKYPIKVNTHHILCLSKIILEIQFTRTFSPASPLAERKPKQVKPKSVQNPLLFVHFGLD